MHRHNIFISFSLIIVKFKRLSFDEALTKNTSLNKKDLDDIDSLRKFAKALKIENFKTLST